MTEGVVCPECGSESVFKAGTRVTAEGVVLQRYLCKRCGRRFSDANPYKLTRTNTGADQLSVILQETKKLVSPQQETSVVEIITKTPSQGQIIDFLWYLKKQGYSDATIKTRVKILKLMNKQSVNLLDPEAVKLFIAKRESWSDGHKQIVVHTYDCFAEMLSIKWTPPSYGKNNALPFVPTEKEVDALIAGCSKKIATSLLAMKETAFRIGELWKCKWTDLDEENSTLKCVAEKHGNPRQIKISARLMSMLSALPKTNDYIFGNSNLSSHRWRFDQQKRALSQKLQNPRLLQIKFHTLRHWKASDEYAKTRNILHVKELLGHRNINSTLVYTHLVPFDDDAEGYYHAAVKTDAEAGELIDQGFQYVCTTPQGTMMFRKRK
jgi:integrase/DNA-directed RNA polymerase subunit RPC12/RpoP